MQFNISSLIIGVLIFLAVIFYIGPYEIANSLSAVDIGIFLLAGVVYLIGNTAGVFKLMFIFPVSFRQAFFSHESGMFFSNLTPAKIGYFYTAYSLKKKIHTSISENVGILTMLQTITLSLKSVALLLAILYFSFSIGFYVFILFLIPLLIISVSLIFLFTKIPHKVLSAIPFFNKLISYVNLMQLAMKKYTRSVVLKYVIMDIIGWFILAFQWFLLFHAIGIDISYIVCLMLQPLITALMYVPFTLNGLGISEIGNALLFTMLDLASGPTAVAFLMLLRINCIVFDSIGLIDLRLR